MDFVYCLLIFLFGASLIGFAALCTRLEKKS